MNQLNLQNRLAVSNGTVKNGQNNAMQPASQTTELPETAKKRLGLLAILAVGVDVAASFLKSKMEKAAAVASQVGAAISESKKVVSAAAASVLVRIRPEPPKKARLASIPILTLLAAFFFAQPQAMAQLNITGPLPYYDKKVHLKAHIVYTVPIIGDLVTPDSWTLSYRFNSEIFSPNWRDEWGMSYTAFECWFTDGSTSMWSNGFKSTTYHTGHGPITTYYYKDKFGRALSQGGTYPHLEAVSHSQVGKKITTTQKVTTPLGGGNPMSMEERTTEEWKCPFYSSPSRPPSPGDIIYHGRSFFLARLEGSTKPDGSCESFGITDPGYETIHYPCVPNNMSMPTNGVIIYSLYNVMRNRITVHDDE